MTRIWSALKSPLGMGFLVVFVVVASLAFEIVRLSARARAWREDLRASQEETMRAQEALVVAEANQRKLGELAADLQAQLAGMERALGQKPKIRQVVKWQTREVEVYPGSPARPADGQEAPTGPQDCPAGEPECPPVRVALDGVEATVETREGAVAVVGQVAIRRTSPPPEEVFKVPFEAEQSVALREREGYRPPRWLVGPAVGVTSEGFAGGAAVVGPPLRLWGLEARPTGTALFTANGQPSIGAGLVIGIGRKK